MITNITDRERELRCVVADLQAENNELRAKLAGAEMPEHDCGVHYTADQLKAYGAACAAAQLSAEPAGYWCERYFDDEQEAQTYCDTKAELVTWVSRLYTLKEQL